MEVWVKNQVLTKKYISRFAFNSTRNILACIADACDSILFYLYLPDHSFVEIFNGISKPSGKKCSIVWSPDGTTLALGSSTLELWKLIHNKIVPLKTYSEDFVDIKVIAWSPDSLSIAYGGLSKKNTIKVRNL
jgi:WD40 repeat protein